MNSEEKIVPIVCPFCGVGCNIELVIKEGKPFKVIVKGRNTDLNGKFICIKGLIVADILNHKDRLKKPLIKSEGVYKEIQWNNALEIASQKLKTIIDKYGADSVGMLVSGKITNEEAYLAQKFARTVIKTQNIDTCARLCHSPSEVALRIQFGYGAVSACLNDFLITDVVMLIGANTRFTHPGIWNKLKKRTKKSLLFVADIFETMPSADIKLTPRPGTDIFWINRISKIIIDKGLHDYDFINNRTIGFESFKKSLKPYTEQYVKNITKIPEAKLQSIAEHISHNRTMFAWGMGLTQHANGTDAVLSIGNLALLTGNLGKEGTGVVPLRGQNNVQGAVDMGCAPFTLPGAYEIEDIGALTHFEGHWDSSLSNKPGYSATEMIHRILDGKIKALYIIGENPALSEPQSAFVRWMLRNLELLIVQDIFLTETAKFADLIFPAAALGEKSGTTTNAARRIQFSEKAIDPPGEALPDWEIIQRLANTFRNNWNYSNSEEIWDEIRKIVPIFKGASYSRLKSSNGLFWPVYSVIHPGTQRLYTKRFMFRDGRARFYPISPPLSYTVTTNDFPFMLITHRLYEQFNTGEMTLRSKITSKSGNLGFIAMNEQDATEYGLSNGSKIRVSSPYGSVVSLVKILKGLKVPKGHLFAPIHFHKMGNFNELTSTFPLDPRARMPSLKKIPVNISSEFSK